MLFDEFRKECRSSCLSAVEINTHHWEIRDDDGHILVSVSPGVNRYQRLVTQHVGGPLVALACARRVLKERDTADEPAKPVESDSKPPLEFTPGGQYANPNHDMTSRVVDLLEASRRLLLLSAAHMVATTLQGQLVNDELRRAIGWVSISLHDFDDDLMPDEPRNSGA